MSAAGSANTITPYWNNGLTAAQASSAAQTGLSGFMNVSNQVMKDPLTTYMYQQAAARSNPNGGAKSGLARMLGPAYGPTVSTKIGQQMLSAYQDAWTREGPNGPLTTHFFNQLTQLAAAQGYTGVQDNILSVGRQIYGINGMGSAAQLAFNSTFAGQNPADYLAGRAAPLGGTSGMDIKGQSISENINMGTQYIAYLKSKNPGASVADIARAYNGGGDPNYVSTFMQGSKGSGLGAYNPGTSAQALMQDALGRGASTAQKAKFQALIPAIMQSAKANNVSPAFVARILGKESAGGTDMSNGTNVMHMTKVAVAQMQSQSSLPGNLTWDQINAISNAPQVDAAALGGSQALYGAGSMALDGFNDAVSSASTLVGTLSGNLATLNGKVNTLIKTLGNRL